MTDDPDRARRLERLHSDALAARTASTPEGEVRVSANVCEAAGLPVARRSDSSRRRARRTRRPPRAHRRRGAPGRVPRPVRPRDRWSTSPSTAACSKRVTPASVDAVADELADGTGERVDAPPRRSSPTSVKVVLENSGHIDPENIDDYLAHDGYRALARR